MRPAKKKKYLSKKNISIDVWVSPQGYGSTWRVEALFKVGGAESSYFSSKGFNDLLDANVLANEWFILFTSLSGSME